MTTDFDKKKNDRKDTGRTDLLMDAIGGIDPRYIEEAEQAVSPDSSGQKLSQKLTSGRKKKLFHSPAPALAAAACLTLLVLAGASRTGLLQNLLISAPEDSMLSGAFSLSDSISEESGYAAEEAAEIDTVGKDAAEKDADEKDIAKKDIAEKDTDREDVAEKEKVEKSADEENVVEKNAAEPILTAPPSMTLFVSGSSSSVFSVLKSSYNWTYPGSADAERITSICDADQIWNISDLPVLSLKQGSSITPDFDDVQPDSFSVRCLAASDQRTADPQDPQQHCVSITVQEDGSFALPEADRSYIVEVTAEWENDLYSGSCTYGFRAEYTEPAE